MKAVTFQGAKDIQVKQVEDPKLQQKDDIIVRVTSTAICGSNLHIYQVLCRRIKIMSLAMNRWESLKKWVRK
ncbi:threonine dehydrogenase-like Zn-dependent dehydrogenase [Peribacillus sp. V2I11]|nr:threonine dehydrogenase-like Zn-dependent dehydrogenase [Peribacillus sp. V2I11]